MAGGVVIINYNRGDDVARLARELASEQWQVVVVDNSGDVDASGFSEEVVVDRPGTNLGYAGACNRAFASLEDRLGADLEWVLFATHDLGLDRAQLRALVAAWRDDSEQVLGPCLVHEDGAVFSAGIGGRAVLPRHWSWSCQAPRGWTWALDGSCWMVSPALLRDVGPLDESYFLYWEDIDWFWRLTQRGYGIRVSGDIHVTASTAGHTAHHAYYTARNRYLFSRKHGVPIPPARSAIWIAAAAVRVVLATARGRRELARQQAARLRGYIDGLRGRMGPVHRFHT